MRIVFLGQTGPFAPVALRHLVAGQGPFEVVLCVEGLTRGTPRGPAHRLREPEPRPLPDGERLSEISVAAGIPALQTSDVNGRRALETIAEGRPDWLVCVGFDRLFGQRLLSLPTHGGINAHPSKLPELRGPSPIFWARRLGHAQSALTLHRLDRREDHGPVLAQQVFALPSLASGEAIFRIAGDLAGTMLVDLLRNDPDRLATGVLQDESRATRAPRPRPEDAQVNPKQWQCQHLVDFASAASFFRAAWMRLGNEIFFARRGIRVEPNRTLPAQYVLREAHLAVQCRDGIAHLEIQT